MSRSILAMFLFACVCLFQYFASGGIARGQSGVACEVNAVACGAFVTTATENEVCAVTRLASLGNNNDRVYTEVTFFVGYRVGGEVLFLGGGSAKTGLRLTCKVPVVDGKPDYSRLKKELPTLLASNPEIQKKFPGIKKIDVNKAARFEPLPSSAKDRVEKDFKPK